MELAINTKPQFYTIHGKKFDKDHMGTIYRFRPERIHAIARARGLDPKQILQKTTIEQNMRDIRRSRKNQVIECTRF